MPTVHSDVLVGSRQKVVGNVGVLGILGQRTFSIRTNRNILQDLIRLPRRMQPFVFVPSERDVEFRKIAECYLASTSQDQLCPECLSIVCTLQ